MNLKEIFSGKKLYAIALKSPDPNFYYFSGIEFGQAEGSLLLLKKTGKPAVIASSLDKGNIAGNKNIKGIEFKSRKELEKVIRKETAGKRIGFNSKDISKRSFDAFRKTIKGKKWADVSEELGCIRAIKSKKEIETISKATRLTEKILNKVPGIVKKGMTERGLAIELHTLALRKRAQELPFPTIVASGPRGRTPHYTTADRKIGKGFLLIDFGIRLENYCSDLSRTFHVGKASRKEKELYAEVFKAKEFAMQEIREGTVCGEIFEKTSEFLKEKTGHEMIHGIGHGLGLEVHDFPTGFLKDCEEIIRNSMVFTVEPAVYGKFGGIRIEDNIAVKNGKTKALSHASEELVEISI